MPHFRALCIVLSLVLVTVATIEGAHGVGFRAEQGRIVVTMAERPVAAYVYDDPRILRPYFANVFIPGGPQVTRNYPPPMKGTDRIDHADMHPGIWLAFGDVNSIDFWRNRGHVRHEAFVDKPTGGADRGMFAVRNRYEAPDGTTVCHEDCRITFVSRGDSYLILWDSSFSNDAEKFSFGDQEEMGLGVRVATPLTVDHGGRIVDANGRRDEREIWGTSSAWCDYSGTVNGQLVGITVMSHPTNFRASWHHARNYGLLVANPFGRHAFHHGEADKVVVRQGEKFRLRFGLFIHAQPHDKPPDIKEAWAEYLRRAEDRDSSTKVRQSTSQ